MKKCSVFLAMAFAVLFLVACQPPDPVGLPDEVGEVDVVSAENGPAEKPVSPTFPGLTAEGDLLALGDPNAPIAMVEYSDFQCPFCRRYAEQTFVQIKREWIDTGQVYYVFRDFPIAGLHPLAYRLHEAARCVAAADLDAFWQAHDLFFAQAERFQVQSEAAMDGAILAALAEAGLPDVAACLQNGEFAAVVQAGVAEGQARGVRGTPSFFVDGNLFAGAQPYTVFEQYLTAAGDGTLAALLQPTPVPAQAGAPVAAPTPATIEPRPVSALGDPDAQVTIVEYSDFQCPFCRRHHQQTLPSLLQNHVETGRVYYVFKDYPIANLHPLAYRLHEAALCVGETVGADGFWLAHDLFFDQAEHFQVDTVAAMDAAVIDALAAAGLLTTVVEDCFVNGEKSAEVQANIAEAQALGVTGTPAFFINGYPLTGAQPLQTFEYAIGLAEEGTIADAYQPRNGPNDGKAQATATAQATGPVDVPLGDAPAKGSVDAPITIVEYSDYQCPFCLRHFTDTMLEIQRYIDAGQVRYVFKDFPLHNIHPQAEKAHEAARCAREQGGDDAYWQMHDLLFTNQSAWGQAPLDQHSDVIKELAAEASLDQSAFDVCLDSGRHATAINNDLQEGSRLGVRGTPAFFINGQFVSGAQPFAVFDQAIQQALASAE
ncbi:MAG: thioredoxin domain-containing protein [Anaerolineae bacterium]|nr:thioredoxin domain-containing protein [Anaerolineae bacterium]